MNLTKRIISVLIIIFYFSSVCYAQKKRFTTSQWLAFHEDDIKSATYIFEGTVLSQSTINKTTVTCSVIQITKIYKGSPQLKLGTIKIITEQSRNVKDADPGLGRGCYIIFGKLGKSNLFDSITTDNSIILTLMANSIAIFGKVSYDRPAAQWDQTPYKTLDSLYSFFTQNGLMVQEQVAQPLNPKDSIK